MNYRKIYDDLINNRKINKLKKTKELYTEVHHIIPSSLGGSDDESNLVRLTGREHFIAHAILLRILKNEIEKYNKMITAFVLMSGKNNKRYINSRLYEKYKGDYSKLKSIEQTGEGNTQFGTKWITDGIDNKKILKDELIPVGWKKGRTVKSKFDTNKIKLYKNLYNDFIENYDTDVYELFKEKHKLNCNFDRFRKNCKKYYKKLDSIRMGNKRTYNTNKIKEYEEEMKEKYTNYYIIYKEHTYKEFCKITNDKIDQGDLVRFFQKYVEDYEYKNIVSRVY